VIFDGKIQLRVVAEGIEMMENCHEISL